MHAPTDNETDDGELIRQQFAQQFPDWRFWYSRGAGREPGELMATRRRDLSKDEIAEGLACTLPMGCDTDLRSQLVEQAERERALGGVS